MRKLPTLSSTDTTAGAYEHSGSGRARSMAEHDGGSLAALLSELSGKGIDRCRRTAAKALRVAFADDHSGDALWTNERLASAGIGVWARPTLLSLSVAPGLTMAEKAGSADGTVRLLLAAHDGALVESVIIPTGAGRALPRTTLCISSQVGCARACVFCETGVSGLSRQLTAAEIVDQYRIARRLCQPDGHDEAAPQRRRAAARPISNIVFMGMGEPFDNLREVIRAVSLLCDPHAFDFAPSRITVSTVGVVDKIASFFLSTRAELAVSLNAPDDARRTRIMPINERFDLAALRAELLRCLPPGRRVLIEYVIFGGFNDSTADADLLADWARGIRCRINVIPANPGPEPSLVAPAADRVDAFVARLVARGITALVRRPRGRDVCGACGQLAGSRRLAVMGLPA